MDCGSGTRAEYGWLPLGKGPRNCISIHLASAQSYVGIVIVHRRFDLELFEMRQNDVEPTRDLFTASVRTWRRREFGLEELLDGRIDRET